MKDDAGYNFLNVTKYPTDERSDATLGIPAPDFVSSPADGAEIISLLHPGDLVVPPQNLRAVPFAGILYPVDTCISIRNIPGPAAACGIPREVQL